MPGSSDITRGASEANDPRHIFKVRSYINATEPHRDRRVLPLCRRAAATGG